tara:strand:+ start:451 stop:1092 length:642 start_codon:yes stop_codon:yes gene_type:complete
MSISEFNNVFYPTTNDSAVVRCLLSGRVWEKKITNIFHQYITHDSVVVDCGTYIGSHSLSMSNLAKKVIGFEPQPLIFKCLTQTIDKQNIKNIKLYNIALSNKQGNTFIMTNNDGDASLEGIRDNKFKHKFPIKTNTLDNIINEKIDLIKIDVEGHEWEMLEGASETITKYRPIIILETFRTKNNKNNLEIFKLQYNYNYQYISADNYLLIPT